jgi:hypothetical protein
LKLNVPPGEIAPLPNVLPVTVWGAPVLFFQTTVVPMAILRLVGLNVKLPLLSVVIETITTVGIGVGVGFACVGVGVGLCGIGVGVGSGRGEGVGVRPAGFAVGEGVGSVCVRLTTTVLVVVGEDVAVLVVLSPPQATSTTTRIANERVNHALCLDKYRFFINTHCFFPPAMLGKMREISWRTHLFPNTKGGYGAGRHPL